MGFRSVCIESRCKCSYAGGYLVVTRGEDTKRIHLSEIAQVTFCTTQVYVSGYLMSELAKAKISVVFSDEKYMPVAECLPMHGAYNTAAHVAEQLEWSVPAKKRLWQKIVKDKIGLQARVLELTGHPAAASYVRELVREVQSGDTTNREAVAASLYFKTLFGSSFHRELDCSLNASLDYGYAIVLSKVAREIASHGYLTHVGVNHRSEVNPWNLASDFMEPFRPIVDIVILRAGIAEFNAAMRHRLIDIMSETVRYTDGYYKLGSVVGNYVKGCFDALNHRIKPDELECYEIE